jgi:hypothetical protein
VFSKTSGLVHLAIRQKASVDKIERNAKPLQDFCVFPYNGNQTPPMHSHHNGDAQIRSLSSLKQ